MLQGAHLLLQPAKGVGKGEHGGFDAVELFRHIRHRATSTAADATATDASDTSSAHSRTGPDADA